MNAEELVTASGMLEHVAPMVILAGSGVSYDAPPSVPLAEGFTWNVLDELMPEGHGLKEKFACLPPHGSAFPRLETVLEVAVAALGSEILGPPA